MVQSKTEVVMNDMQYAHYEKQVADPHFNDLAFCTQSLFYL